jgi:hypothetical protein
MRSVQLNMSGFGSNLEGGDLQVTNQNYVLSNSRLHYFDFLVVPGKTVNDFCQLVILYRRDAYRMTGSGNGCRYWT